MAGLWNALVQAYSYLAVVPMIPFLIIYLTVKLRSGDKKRAIQLSMDVTTLFLIGIVSSQLNQMGTSFGPYIILLFMLITAGLIGNAQNRIRGKVNARKLIRAIWRLSFLVLSVLYVLLMIIELAKLAFTPLS
ncbi:DUF3397 domain-containing protein [Cohnella lubricantis]|uniref:DUF3397 domain-containing protein n=1 Tax=Cohnella lubricantis TaxID=2163172 RepID=A0A841TDB9_9BACL|nr:DUF3397 domain-containing protein [Cohnella lubricantis]MBB6677338.1 DUF3397 domain-containing protein [Cohnella lubricantis]MBP2116850.1 F0F1-type ATP synthase membrane subunit a [Cohnella lubricantis]